MFRSPLRPLTLACAALAALELIGPSPCRAAGLLVADGGFGGQLEIASHEVEVTVNNGVAVTKVTQVFRNLEDRQVEALYTFPVPKKASVSNFSMWIAGQEMVGEVLEKKRAREIYESYKRRNIDPGLLEQVDYKTFEMRIFPIAPRAEQRVEVVYYQELAPDHNWATYVYPLATVTRQDITARTNGPFSFRIDVKSEVPIAKAESPSHGDDLVVANHSTTYFQGSIETEGGDLSRDLVFAYELERPKTGLDLVASRPRGEDGYFVLQLTAGKDLEKLETGMDYVFVLDISGSMAQKGKLGTSRRSIEAFIEALGPKDRFELITFNVQAKPLFAQLVAADEANLSRTSDYLAQQEGRGGTSITPAILRAYGYGDPDRRLNVVVLSDGMTDQRDRRPLERILGERPAQARVFCVGVGNEINRPLLRQVAERAGGLASFISRGDDFERQAKAFRRKLTHPVAEKVRIEVEGVDVYDLEPKELPSLYYGAPVRLYGRYRKPGRAKLRLKAEIAGREIATTEEIVFPENAENPEIERMWAWHSVDRLLQERDAKGTSPRLERQIVDLGETYSIVTPYTSFLVLENDAEYKRWRIERRNLRRLTRDRRAQQTLAKRLEQIRESAVEGVGPGAVKVARQTPKPAAEVPTPQASSRPQGSRPSTPQPAPRRRSRGVDIDLPLGGGGGGGGPIGPAFVALSLWLARRKRRDGAEAKPASEIPREEC